jgi:hypothetical protein
MRLGADLIPYPLVDLEGQHRVKQRAGVRLAQAFDRQLRQPGELTAQRTGRGTMASHIIPLNSSSSVPRPKTTARSSSTGLY